MKCKRCNDASALAQKYPPAFRKTPVTFECPMHESYLKRAQIVLDRFRCTVQA